MKSLIILSLLAFTAAAPHAEARKDKVPERELYSIETHFAQKKILTITTVGGRHHRVEHHENTVSPSKSHKDAIQRDLEVVKRAAKRAGIDPKDVKLVIPGHGKHKWYFGPADQHPDLDRDYRAGLGDVRKDDRGWLYRYRASEKSVPLNHSNKIRAALGEALNLSETYIEFPHGTKYAQIEKVRTALALNLNRLRAKKIAGTGGVKSKLKSLGRRALGFGGVGVVAATLATQANEAAAANEDLSVSDVNFEAPAENAAAAR